MAPLAHHLMFRPADGRVLALDVVGIRTVARVVLTCGWDAGLLAFGLADTHLHALVLADRTAVGRFAQRVGVSLKRRLGLAVCFAPTHVVPVADQRHLANAFGYVLRQDDRHGLGRDPLREGTSLLDLLGARVPGAWMAARVRQVLPRIGRAELVGQLPSGEALDGPVVEDPASLLAESAASAALLPSLSGRSLAVVEARRAAIAVGRRASLGTSALARCLDISTATVRRLRDRSPDDRLVAAIEAQLRLRRALREVPDAPFAPTLRPGRS
jgi:hypothetical protein